MKYYNTIIFDFDGTIADSYLVTYRIYNELAQKHNLRPIPESDIPILRTMKPFELLSYFHIPFHKIPFLLFEGRNLFKKYVHELKPIPGIKGVLEQLHKTYQLGILTSNNAENVEYFLKKHTLELFDFIHSEKNLFGKDTALLHLIEKHGLEKSKTMYVGDEVRDIQSCQKIQMSIISVAWGFNEAGILGKQHPSYLIQHPEEMLNIL
ncbi:MAG TPA: HAD-IA family hydrolase [Candidatus Woesebacteria bacterium]|nr:HAD-IA family hydrolase [Candidatus Woesebacteria bacterium]